MNLHPFYRVLENFEKVKAEGHGCFQQFECEHCGAKNTMQQVGIFFKRGTCGDCQQITDIEKTGCNFAVMMRPK